MCLRAWWDAVVLALIDELAMLWRKHRANFALYLLLDRHGLYYREFSMEWKDVDWQTLHRLRERFLRPVAGDYWASPLDLEHYDLAFAPRIAVKWDAVWAQAAPAVAASGPWNVVDWGCGTGVASRTLIDAVGPGAVESVEVWDRSALARRFALRQIEELGVKGVEGNGKPPSGRTLLLISHVANELNARAEKELAAFLDAATALVWVEPGTPEASRRLIEEREKRRAKIHFSLPCPHSGVCGLAQSTRDWCHQFAPPRPEFFTQSEWVHFGKRMQIDLRSAPVSFLVGALPGVFSFASAAGVMLGRPDVSKSEAKKLVCRADGVIEREVTRLRSKKEGDTYRALGFLGEKKDPGK